MDLPGVEPGRLGVSTQSSKPAKPTPTSLSQNTTKGATWTKVIYLSPGDEIAVVDSSKVTQVKFVKITSIEYVGRKQVYDIEVEGTHNFVANGIIAHNTYISDKLGIGTTNASYALNVSTNANIGTTLTTASLNLTSTAVGASSVAAYLSGNSGLVGYLDTTSWDKDSSDDITSLQEGYAIDITGSGVGRTISFDSTEIIGATTWGAGSTQTWIFDTGATDPSVQFGNDYINFTSGLVGIGSTNASYDFYVTNSAGIGKTLNATTLSLGGSVVTSTAAEINFLDGSAVTDGGIIYGDGTKFANTGVGSSGQYLMSDGANAPVWTAVSGGGTTYYEGSGITLDVGSSFSLGGALTQDARLNVGSTEVMFWDYPSGNVGIGTTSPGANLDVMDSSNPVVKISQDSTHYLSLGYTTATDLAVLSTTFDNWMDYKAGTHRFLSAQTQTKWKR